VDHASSLPFHGECSIYSKYSIDRKKMAKPQDTYTTSDLSRKSGDIIAEALRRPVTITQRNKPRLMLMNVKHFDQLCIQADPRRVGTIETMDDELFAEVKKAIEEYANSDEPDD
jgi:prevent-host-death family protein